jgi:hypothetical protein
MVSGTSNTPGQVAEPMLFSIAPTPASIDSTNSFELHLESALESYLGQSGIGPELDTNISAIQRQESAVGQNFVPLTTLGMSDTSVTPSTPGPGGTTTPQPSTSPVIGGPFVGPALSLVLQNLANDWSALTPQQVAFQLANASGMGGGNPTDMVPGTSLTFGQLNQTQQAAYQYALNYGTGGLSMQDFLSQNTGPQAAWNISYDQSQLIPGIQAAADSSYEVAGGGVPMPIQAPEESGTLPAASGNVDNLPNPAMIQYLPKSQQAAAEAAVAAEGLYGENVAAAASAYEAM